MSHKEKVNGAVKYGTRDRNPRRKYDYDSRHRIAINDSMKFSTGAKARLFILLLIISTLPLFIALIIWGNSG